MAAMHVCTTCDWLLRWMLRSDWSRKGADALSELPWYLWVTSVIQTFNHRFQNESGQFICSFCYFWIWCLIKRTCKTQPHPCTTWGCRGCHQSCFAAHGSGTAAPQCFPAPQCVAQSRPPGTDLTHLRQYRVNKTQVRLKGHSRVKKAQLNKEGWLKGFFNFQC